MAQKSKPVMPAGHQQQGMSENMNAVDAIIKRLHRALVYHDQDPRGIKAMLCRAEAEIVRLYPTPAVDGCLVGTCVSKEQMTQEEQDNMQCILEYIDAQRVEDEQACIRKAVDHDRAYARRHKDSHAPKRDRLAERENQIASIERIYSASHLRMPVNPGLKDVEDIGALEASRVFSMRNRLSQVRLDYDYIDGRKMKTIQDIRHASELYLERTSLEEALSIYPRNITLDDQNEAIFWTTQQFIDRGETWAPGMMLDMQTNRPVLIKEGEDEGLGNGRAYTANCDMSVVNRRKCFVCAKMHWLLEEKRGKEEAELALQDRLIKHLEEQVLPCGNNCRMLLGARSYDVAQRIADKEERAFWKDFTPGSAPVHDIVKLVIGDEKVCDIDGEEADKLGINAKLHGLTDEQIHLEDLCFRRDWDQSRKEVLEHVNPQKRMFEPRMSARLKLRLLQGRVSAFINQGGYQRGDVFFMDRRKYVVASNEWMKAIDLLDANYVLIGALNPVEAQEMLEKAWKYDAWDDKHIDEIQTMLAKDPYKARVHNMPLRQKVLVTFFVPFSDKAITRDEYLKAYEAVLIEEGKLPEEKYRTNHDAHVAPVDGTMRHVDLESVHVDLLKRKKEAVATLRIHLWGHIRDKNRAEAEAVADRISYLTDYLAFFGCVPDTGVPVAVKRAARANGTWFNKVAFEYMDTEARLGAYLRQFSNALEAYLMGEKTKMAEANRLIRRIHGLQMNLGQPMVQMEEALVAAKFSMMQIQ